MTHGIVFLRKKMAIVARNTTNTAQRSLATNGRNFPTRPSLGSAWLGGATVGEKKASKFEMVGGAWDGPIVIDLSWKDSQRATTLESHQRWRWLQLDFQKNYTHTVGNVILQFHDYREDIKRRKCIHTMTHTQRLVSNCFLNRQYNWRPWREFFSWKKSKKENGHRMQMWGWLLLVATDSFVTAPSEMRRWTRWKASITWILTISSSSATLCFALLMLMPADTFGVQTYLTWPSLTFTIVNDCKTCQPEKRVWPFDFGPRKFPRVYHLV